MIGNEWDTSIDNVTFKITMPKSFDESLLGFSSGYKGSIDNLNISYSVNGNVISGSLTGTLYSGHALTVRLSLPEDYFVGESLNIDTYVIVVIIISLICVFIGYRLWAKYGKEDEVVETVEFYPPEGYNSAEVAFLYNGYASTSGVVSLLIYLANAGYLKIEEIEEEKLFDESKSFRITKLKEYDGNNKNEKIFFDGLFQDKQKTSVTKKDLCNKFYRTIDEIKSNLDSKENKNKIFESSVNKKRWWITAMIILILMLITFKPFVEYPYTETGEIIVILLFPIIGILLISFVSYIFQSISIKDKKMGIVIGAVFAGIPWLCIMFPRIKDDFMYIVMCIIGIICIVVLFFFIQIMSKRTPYGNKMLGKIRGFKRFLEIAEKTQLESLVAQQPEYFYDILPYTYSLGVSDVWIKQFESISLKAPSWYETRNDFNINSFGAFFTTTMASARSAMVSSPSSDSGGSSSRRGSSGGGSAGGGSGGGGGGSW